MKKQKIAVIGAGTMGSGIAHVFAMHDYETHLIDTSEKVLNSALGVIDYNLNRMVTKETITSSKKGQTMANIKTFTELKPALEGVSLCIEAVPEDLELKKNVFGLMEGFTDSSCILASNTSSISITSLASEIDDPSRVIGMHFMNPVPIMPLVEIVTGYETSEDTISKIQDYVNSLEKTGVVVEDYPGFISNRVLIPMINEAIYALHESIATAEEIDTIMRLGMNHPMGPLELADFIGLDVVHSICMVLYNGFGRDKYFPCPLLTNMVQAGKFGRKSGEGFYAYDKE